MKIHINIGSNKGDSRSTIERAVALVIAQWPEATVSRSDFIESDPWGYESENRFTNLGLMLEFDHDVDLLAMLHSLQAIERSICTEPHRNADGTYRDRIVDIDMIAADNLTMDTAELTLPHPRALQRPFVMLPLLQLQPDWTHPKPSKDV